MLLGLLDNASDLQLECDRVLYETLLMSAFMYGSKRIIWKEKRSRIRTMQIDNFRGLLGIRRVEKVPNVQM